MTRTAGLVAALVAGLLGTACDDDTTSPATADADTSSSTDTMATDTAMADDDTASDTDDPMTGCEAATISIVTGLVHGDDGQPLEDARAQSCVRQPGDRLVCLRPSSTDADGRFSQSVPADARCTTGITLRALLPDSPRATTYCPLPLPDNGSPVISLTDPIVLHTTSPATDLPPEGDADAVRTVTFADGATLELAPSALYTGTERGYADLALARVATDAPGLCFPRDAATDALVAFSPEADLAAPGATLRLPNDDGLAPGTQLAADVLGGLDCRLADDTLVPEGTWAAFGTATVSADGTTIEIVGVPCLTWLRLR